MNPAYVGIRPTIPPFALISNKTMINEKSNFYTGIFMAPARTYLRRGHSYRPLCCSPENRLVQICRNKMVRRNRNFYSGMDYHSRHTCREGVLCPFRKNSTEAGIGNSDSPAICIYIRLFKKGNAIAGINAKAMADLYAIFPDFCRTANMVCFLVGQIAGSNDSRRIQF